MVIVQWYLIQLQLIFKFYTNNIQLSSKQIKILFKLYTNNAQLAFTYRLIFEVFSIFSKPKVNTKCTPKCEHIDTHSL